jgi:arsenite-transporting ATPase
LHQRALNELVEINAVASQYSKRYAVVPMLKDEPIGVQRLQNLAAG